jgi:hypothetical protein
VHGSAEVVMSLGLCDPASVICFDGAGGALEQVSAWRECAKLSNKNH